MPAKTSKKSSMKAAAPKKVAAKKCATQCECAMADKPAQTECCATKARKATRVIVKFNAGWGNQLFIRGMGAGLDWQKGVPMQCVGEDEWLWEQLVPNGTVSFKVLINDQAWCTGDDFTVNAGDSIICRPEF